MRPRYAVFLTPLESAVPQCTFISKQMAPLTPLESALTSHPQLVENTATLSLVEYALTNLSPATSLESALTKTPGVGGYSSDSGTRHLPLISRHYTQVLSFHILAHSFAHFRTHQKLNPLIFNRLRTLCQKTPGGGCTISARKSLQGPTGFDPVKVGPSSCPTSHQSPVTGPPSPCPQPHRRLHPPACILSPCYFPPLCVRGIALSFRVGGYHE